MSKVKEQPILKNYLKRAKQFMKEGNPSQARDQADYGLLTIAKARENGLPDDSIIEGYPMDTWLMRFWVFLENNGLMLE